jgi:hypothetical protein
MEAPVRDGPEFRVRHHLEGIEIAAREDLWWHRYRDAQAGLNVDDADAAGISMLDVPPEPESRNMRAIRRKRERAVRRVLRQIPKVTAAAEAEDAWVTAEAALDLLTRVTGINMVEADAVIAGRARKETGARVGRRGHVASNEALVEKLCERVELHLQRDPSMSHWSACKAVAGEWNRKARFDETISPDTVKRHTLDLRQRLRPR